MAGYHVTFRISCPKPTADALAFLGPMKATAAYNANRLAVGLEVATVTAVDGVLLPPGRLFRRKRN
jgi:hypothetical protein